MAKSRTTDRPLMRQKVNITESLMKKYKDNYFFHIRQLIHSSFMKPEDLYTTFEHQERVFEIIGLTDSDTMMLRECREEGVFFWECQRYFVQMKLGRFNSAFDKENSTRGNSIWIPMEYTQAQLLLPPKPRKRRRKVTEEEHNQEEV
jgi:hypothetical protein